MKLASTAALAALVLTLATAAPAAETDLPLQELPSQKLDLGQCALVLWTRTSPARRVFMALSQPAGARLQTKGHTLDLARTGWDGQAVYGHYPSQTFSGAGWQVKATVQFDTAGPLVGGALAPSGSLELRDEKGWSMVVPVAGMVACRS